MAKNATIGALRVQLGLDSAQFETGLKQARAELSGFGKVAGVAGAAIGAALAGTAVAVGAAIKATIDRAEELGETAQKIGVPVDELSKLKHAADMSGVSMEGLSTGLKRLSANMMEAAGSTEGKAARAFQALGVSVVDANGALRPTSAVVQDLAGEFAGMEDGAGKTALAMAIFGKSGADLIPMLNEGKDGVAALMTEAEQLGLVIDEKTARAADAFNDNLQRLGLVQQGVVTQITAGMLPGLESLSAMMVSGATNTEFMDQVSATLSGTLKLLAVSGVIVGAVFDATFKTVMAVAHAVMQVTRGDFSGAIATLNQKLDSFDGIGERISAVWNATGGAVRGAVREVKAAAPVIEQASKAKKKALTEEEKAHKKAKEAADRYIESLQKEIDTFGMTSEQVKQKEDLAAASEALAAGLLMEAAAILRLAEARRQLAGVEWQKAADPGALTTIGSPEIVSGLDLTIDKLGEALDSADQLAWSIEGVFNGLKNGDWMGAAMNAVRAFQKMRESGQSLGETLAGIGVAVGNMVGGVAGAGISGASSGALTGFMVGGPVGAVVGGILGGLGGIFGASKAKKRAKKQAREQARLEAERKAQQLADARRELEIRLMELQGKSAEALTARRKAELAAMDESLRALQEQVWAAEDAAEAEAKLAQEREILKDLEMQLLEVTDAAAAAELSRQQILESLPENLRDLQRAVWGVQDANAALAAAQEEAAALVEDARDDLAAAYDREAEALRGVIDRFTTLADTLADFGKELAGDVQAAADPRARAAATGAEARRLSALAAGGDAEAMAQLPEAIRAWLAAEEAIAPTAQALAGVRGEARDMVSRAEQAARAQADDAQSQLDQLTASVAALLQLNETVLSVREAIVEMHNRLYEADMIQAHAEMALAEQVARAADAALAAAQAAQAATQAAMRPSEADAGLAQQLEDQAALLSQLVVNTGQTSRYLDDVTQGGDSLRTVAA
ncbi:hypothetical protein [Phenylobacterium sp.]|uniref:hypothetical protein n=1 Tax=Phenylobacterium sp. TaxID=1871053 RepID=UPI00391D2EB1